MSIFSRLIKGLFITGVFVVGFAWASTVEAAIVTWDGGGGVDTNWGTCANWSSNVCPTSADIATFDSTSDNNATIAVTLSGATAPAGIDINVGYDGTITQNSGVILNIGTSSYAQDAGTFVGGDSLIDLNNTFTLVGGTFTSTSGTFDVAGAWTHTVGGTFAHNNGTVTFTGNGATIDVATTETFYHVLMASGNTNTKTIAAGDTIFVAGNFEITDGGVATGSIEARGNVTIGSGTDTLSSPFKMNGTGDQTLTYSVSNKFTGGFTVDKSAGEVNLATSFTTSSGTFTLTNGTFDTQGNNVSLFTYVQTGGTLTGGATTTFDINNTFALSGGTFSAPTGTVNVASTWTHTGGGTFTHNSGTVEFDGNSSTIDVAVSETFGGLRINKANTNTLTVSAGDTLFVTSTLTLTDGSWATGTIEAQGDVSIVSTYDTNGTGTLRFSGTSTQTLTLTGITDINNGDVFVNKLGGQVNLAGTLILNASSQDFKIEEGTFDLNGNNLTVNGTSGTLVVESGGNLQLQGSETITANASNPQISSGSTVTYDGSSTSYTLKDYTYHHLVIAGGSSSVFALAANETFGGNVTISTGILDQAGFTLGVTSTFSNDATLRRQQIEAFTGSMDVDSGTVEYVGDNDGAVESVTVTDFGTTDYYNLKINDVNASKDTFSIGSVLTVAGTLQVSSSSFSQGANAVTLGALTVDGGTFTGGSSSVTVGGAVTLSSGALTSTTNTLSVSGGWTHTAGGTFAENGGAVTFTGSAATIDVATTETFAALTISKTDGQALTIATGDTLAVSGTLTLGDGAIATGTLNAQGNAVVSAGWDGGSGAVTFTGTATQTLDLTGAITALDNAVTVNKTSGSLTLASALTLDAASADWNVAQGTFATGGYALTTASGSDITVSGGTMNAGASVVSLTGALTVSSGTYNAETSTATHVGTVTVSGGTMNSNDGTPTFSGAFSLSSGAYNGGTNTDTFAGGLTISGGVFTASDATTVVSGGWTHTAGGTFTPNDGTVSFTGSAATIDVATTETFASLVVNKSNTQTLTIASGDSLVATTALTLTNGAVGTGTLEAQGGVTVGSGFDGGNAALKFSGAASQVFTLTGAIAKFDGDIEVAKSGSSVTLGSALTMDAAGQDLTVTSGTFSTSGTNYALIVAGDVAANGGTLQLNGSTVDVNGNLAVAGGVLDMGSAVITLAGNATYSSGTMTPGTSNVTLDGGDQQFFGATSWYSLTKDVVAAATLTFPSSTVTTVSGALHLAGVAENLLSLRSSTDGVQHTITVTGSAVLSYLSVKDSYATITLRCLTISSGCADAGGNTGWTFRTSGSSVLAGDSSTTVGESQASRLPVVTVLSPNGGEAYSTGESVNITWSTTNGGSIVNVLVSTDGGETWDTLAEQLANDNVYTWVIPTTATSSQTTIAVQTTDLATITAEDMSDDVFSIAIATSDDVDVVSTEDVAEIAERIAELPDDVAIHGLIKLADDGNAATQADSAVYYVGADGKRHAFPNEHVYRSWFCGFDNVRIVNSEELSSIALGVNVTYRPGVRMVKFLSIPKVYAVDQLGVLRWISTENVAKALYGSAWNTLIDDVSDAFYGNYEFGEPITNSGEYSVQEAERGAIYPSDNITIPGYTPSTATEALTCE